MVYPKGLRSPGGILRRDAASWVKSSVVLNGCLRSSWSNRRSVTSGEPALGRTTIMIGSADVVLLRSRRDGIQQGSIAVGRSLPSCTQCAPPVGFHIFHVTWETGITPRVLSQQTRYLHSLRISGGWLRGDTSAAAVWSCCQSYRLLRSDAHSFAHLPDAGTRHSS